MRICVTAVYVILRLSEITALRCCDLKFYTTDGKKFFRMVPMLKTVLQTLGLLGYDEQKFVLCDYPSSFAASTALNERL